MKTIQVGDVYKLHGTASLIVPENTSLEDVITKFALEPSIRGAFLTDSRGRLAGVITRVDLLKRTRLQLYGGKGRHEIRPWEFFRIVDAKKAKDLVRSYGKELTVRETDNLQTALDKMLDYEEDVIPVIDKEGKILGDLRLSEVLLKALEVGRGKAYV